MRNAKRVVFIAVFIIFGFAGVSAGSEVWDLYRAQKNAKAAVSERPTAMELVDRYTEALDSTLSFIENYEKTTNFSYRTAGAQDKGKKFVRGQVRHDNQRYYYQEYNWGDFNIRLKDLPEDEPYYRCYITNGREKMGYYNCRRIGKSVKQGSAARYPLRNTKVNLSRHFGISYILGYIGSDERLDAILRNADSISLRKRTARVAGSDCYVIQAETKCGLYALWLDPQHGYNAAKIRRSAKGGDYTHGRLLSDGETAKTYLDNIRFEKIGETWVPMEAKAGCDRRMPSGDFVKDDYHYKRTDIILNPDHNKLGSFAEPIFENPANDPELINGTRVEITFAPNNWEEYTWQDGTLIDKKGNKVDIEKIRNKIKK